MDIQLIIAIIGFVTAVVGLAAAYIGRKKEIVHRHVGDDPTTVASQSIRSNPTAPTRAAQTEAQRLRTLLVADLYNVEVRRAYLAARTNDLLEHDRQTGREKAWLMLPAMLICGALLGGMLGVLLGVETQEARVFGISVGREFKSLNPVPVVIFALIGAALTYALKPALETRLATLWGEVGPVPDELIRTATDKIKRKLFGQKSGWFS